MIFRWDYSRLDKFERTGDGGMKIPAYLSRSGVLTYQNQDGTVRKELRHPDEIFAKDSLESLKHVALTEGHQAVIDAGNWKNYAVGFVGEDVRRDGDKIAATIHVKDASTISKIERGDLKEISLGYTVDLQDEKGNFDGEEYTHRQLAPKYNHAALGGASWGRAGPEVGLRLDGLTYLLDDSGKLEAMATDKAVPPTDNGEIEKLRGENALLKASLETATKAVDQARTDAKEAHDKSIAIREQASKVLGWDKVKGSDKEVMLATIQARSKEFKADGLSDEALGAAFAFALTLPAPGLAAVQPGTDAAVTREDEKDEVGEAYSRMVKKNMNAWKVA